MLERALDAEVPASWVTADEVYGGDPALRVWLEDRGVCYVLAVKAASRWGRRPQGSVRATAIQVAATLAAEQWVTCSADHGAKGRRLCDWTRVQLAAPAAAGGTRWLLVRRSRRDGELAFYACSGPAETSLLGLVRVAGTRWAVEEGFQQAKTEVGLDHYEVRRWPGWYRHITLTLLAMPSWSSPAPRPAPATTQRGGGGLTSQLGLLPLTVPEVRRLPIALVWTTPLQPGFVLPGHGGGVVTRLAPAADTTNDANNKCGWSTRPGP
jgi:hypothetical protein